MKNISHYSFIALGTAGFIMIGLGATQAIKKVNMQISDISILKKQEIHINPIESIKDIQYPLYDTVLTTNQQSKKTLELMSNFDLPKDLKDNQISRVVAQLSFSNQYWFGALASEAEGFRSKIYNDNIGFAVGNGWNMSMQSASYNRLLASTISQDHGYQQQAQKMSLMASKVVRDGDFSFQISPQRSLQVAGLMSLDFYKNGLVPAIEKQAKKKGTNAQAVLSKIAPNQRDALIYHTYKVGHAGVAKYTQLLNAVIDYSQLPETKKQDIEEIKKVSLHFTYKYKLDGREVQDTRASFLVASMFTDTNLFAHIISKVPQGSKNLSSKDVAKMLPDFKSNVQWGDDVNIPDPVADIKNDMLKRGVAPQAELSNPMADKVLEQVNKIRVPVRNNPGFIMGV